MPASRPFFSVIMPTHLRPQMLRRALESLRRQSFADMEIIVVADAWDQQSAVVAAELLGPKDIFIKRHGPPGPAESRNLGMQMMRGEWVVFLDDDDTFLPHHLQTLHTHAQAAESQVLFTDCQIVTEDRSQPEIAAMSSKPSSLVTHAVDSLWVKNFIPNHALAYRRTALEGCSFDAHLASLEDWDFLLSVCTRRGMPKPYPGGGVVMHKDYVNPGNRRGTQETSKNSTVVLDYIHIYRRWPAPTAELKSQRRDFLAHSGLNLPADWF